MEELENNIDVSRHASLQSEELSDNESGNPRFFFTTLTAGHKHWAFFVIKRQLRQFSIKLLLLYIEKSHVG